MYLTVVDIYHHDDLPDAYGKIIKDNDKYHGWDLDEVEALYKFLAESRR